MFGYTSFIVCIFFCIEIFKKFKFKMSFEISVVSKRNFLFSHWSTFKQNRKRHSLTVLTKILTACDIFYWLKIGLKKLKK